MKIAIWNLKGGQGKTVLSLSLAMLKGFYVVTNDVHSPIDDVLPDGHALRLGIKDALPDVPGNIDLIYDFWGYPDSRVIEAAKKADHVIIPMIYASPLEMQVTINAVAEIEPYTKNIVIVVNKTISGNFKRAKKVLREFYNYPIFEIKQSNAFGRAIEKKKSMKEMSVGSGLLRFHYKKPLAQLQALLDFIS